MHLTLVPWSFGQYDSFNLSQLPGEYTALSYRGTRKAYSFTISTSTLAGTHIPLGEEKQLWLSILLKDTWFNS